MNGAGEQRYLVSHEKLSKKLRLMYPCHECGENDYLKKEAHHIDGNKKNGSIDNFIVLCQDCHRKVHRGALSVESPHYNISGYSVTVAQGASSVEDWFNSKIPLKILPNLHPSIALKFRKDNIKAFVTLGSCHYYIGMSYNGVLIGVLGFSNPTVDRYDLLMTADTTISDLKHSNELLLYMLKTKYIQSLLENKFGRRINNVYTACISKHKVISRYRKHATKVKEVKKGNTYDLGYEFSIGTISTIKAAKSLFTQSIEKR